MSQIISSTPDIRQYLLLHELWTALLISLSKLYIINRQSATVGTLWAHISVVNHLNLPIPACSPRTLQLLAQIKIYAGYCIHYFSVT